MAQYNKEEHKETESLIANAYLHVILHMLEQLIPLLHNFENPEQTSQFDELVHPADPRNPHHVIHISRLGARNNDVERNDGQKIYREPGVQVIFRYLAPIVDQLEVVVVEGRVENEDDVHQEHDVD